jgi:hypothetical protein
MRVIAALMFVAVAGCASGHPDIDRTADRTVRIVGAGGGQLRMTSSDAAKPTTVAFPIDRTWGALKAVYDSLEIPKDNLDDVQHVIGHSGVKAHRRLGTVPLSRIIDCGSTQGTPSADTYDIQISVFTHLTPGGAGMTNITTQVEAVGRPMQFAGEYVHCSTKGSFEAMLVDAVKARLLAAR